jgi:hypothetical protein
MALCWIAEMKSNQAYLALGAAQTYSRKWIK